MARYRGTGNIGLDLAIFATSVVIVLLVRFGIKHWPKIVYCCVPKSVEYAKVRYVHATAISWNKQGDEANHIHTAGFELADGRRIKLYITHEDYVMLRAGTEGYLTRKGGWFLGFEAGKRLQEEQSCGILTHEID